MNESIGTIESVMFRDEEGNAGVWVTIKVADDSKWGPGMVKITRLDQ